MVAPGPQLPAASWIRPSLTGLLQRAGAAPGPGPAPRRAVNASGRGSGAVRVPGAPEHQPDEADEAGHRDRDAHDLGARPGVAERHGPGGGDDHHEVRGEPPRPDRAVRLPVREVGRADHHGYADPVDPERDRVIGVLHVGDLHRRKPAAGRSRGLRRRYAGPALRATGRERAIQLLRVVPPARGEALPRSELGLALPRRRLAPEALRLGAGVRRHDDRLEAARARRSRSRAPCRCSSPSGGAPSRSRTCAISSRSGFASAFCLASGEYAM